ncbi:MAG: Pyridoxamine 5-phosphate oxidase like [Firmicutes bacterium]|nr:Pyridoxamine 5-phosphate oxidase like [Bacillota bacterium]
MFDPEIVEILKNNVFFLGTAQENVPRVRPMRPFVDETGNIWLISYKNTEKTKEIALNNKVELCTVDDHNNVLRLQGWLQQEKDVDAEELQKARRQIVEQLSGVKEFFKEAGDPNMTVYKLIVDQVIFRSLDNAVETELHFRR